MSQVFQLIAFSSSITRYWQQICKTDVLFAEFGLIKTNKRELIAFLPTFTKIKINGLRKAGLHYPDLGNASDWSCSVGNLIQPIRSTIQIWVVTYHQYEISSLVSQTSFGGETSGSVAKCGLFSQAIMTMKLIEFHLISSFSFVFR